MEHKALDETEPLPFDALLRDTVAELLPVAESRSVRLLLASDAPLSVRSDRRRLDTVLFRFLESALSLTRGGGDLRIAANPEPGHVHLVVSWMPGPPPEHSPFSRQELGLLIAQAGWEQAGAEWTHTRTETAQTCTVRLPASPRSLAVSARTWRTGMSACPPCRPDALRRCADCQPQQRPAGAGAAPPERPLPPCAASPGRRRRAGQAGERRLPGSVSRPPSSRSRCRGAHRHHAAAFPRNPGRDARFRRRACGSKRMRDEQHCRRKLCVGPAIRLSRILLREPRDGCRCGDA